ncbi:hypothetical protein [Thermococcus thioreducens]|uniref:Uncharacterized protein n=1 Tax=Thermococcus thioreducens TaxID=277988 RepID=A0A0Q2XLH6_9EURY|nr:hypothetical protein [Thermococcus thioreducens]KQH82036.1 hypothetical protein AMR53_08090 [Thermococcus thioreducens]SEV86452.1 hypothetical protein SAMN05216170_0486 [Thermococcus thioreducens]
MYQYHVIMSVGGILVLLGIFLTWNLSRDIEKFRLGTKSISRFMFLGGLLTALGFIELMLGMGTEVMALPAILGPALIVYALSESGLVRAKPEMLIQVAVIVGSLVLSGNRTLYVIESFSAIAVVILMDAAAFYVHTPQPHSRAARLSAWLFTLFVPLNAAEPGNPVAMGLYIISTALWVAILVALHGVLRERFPRTAQESL